MAKRTTWLWLVPKQELNVTTIKREGGGGFHEKEGKCGGI